jgi:hypothetical protein
MFMSSSLHSMSSRNRFRSYRMGHFINLVEKILLEKPSCTVLDVGGTHNYWRCFGGNIDWKRVRVKLLNLSKSSDPDTEEIVQVIGDACNMSEFADNSFDLVHSNSVIEHVGQWPQMEAMASEIRRVSSAYFVQTPSFWFPVEAHARFPFFHFLPEPIRVSLVMRHKLGFWDRAENVGDATRTVQSAVLLHKRQMAHLFPDAEIVTEKAIGLTKSYMAIKKPR